MDISMLSQVAIDWCAIIFSICGSLLLLWHFYSLVNLVTWTFKLWFLNILYSKNSKTK